MTREREHDRRSIRLHGYDYRAAGAYFVTVCAHDKSCLFGRTMDGSVRVNALGGIVFQSWEGINEHFANAYPQEFVVMPNHFHGIISIHDPATGMWLGLPRPAAQPCVGAGLPRPYTHEPSPIARPTLGQIVAYFKYQSTKRINELRGTPGSTVWQRNYYEHIIRNETEMANVRFYIQRNPGRWASDRENPDRSSEPDMQPWE
jgi:REP element-mobilizing transposase RayT